MFRQTSKKIVPVLNSAWKNKVYPQRPEHVRRFWDIARPSDFRSMIRDMDRQMERFEREVFDHFPLRKMMPRAIPVEGNEALPYRMNIDVSGFKPEEINVSIKDKCLTIRAKMERTGEDGSKFYQEVSREMTLPDNVVASEVKSFLSPNGVLVIEAPMQSPEKPKEIPVNSEAPEKSITSK